jgi:hypothetical protein
MKLLTTIAAVLISISAFSQDYVEHDNYEYFQSFQSCQTDRNDLNDLKRDTMNENNQNIVINNRLKNKETEPLLQWYRYRLLHLHRLIGTKKSPASLQGFLKG